MSVIEINTDPTRRQLNQFGFIWLGFFAAVGAVARFKWQAHELSLGLWIAAVVVPVLGWSVPRVMRWVYLGMSYLAWPIGFVVSHVVLGLVYYAVMTPIGVVMRVLGYDPMARATRPEQPRGPGQYFRQF